VISPDPPQVLHRNQLETAALATAALGGAALTILSKMLDPDDDTSITAVSAVACVAPSELARIRNKEAVAALEQAFRLDPSASASVRQQQLAQELDVSPQKIQAWFRDRRQRERLHHPQARAGAGAGAEGEGADGADGTEAPGAAPSASPSAARPPRDGAGTPLSFWQLHARLQQLRHGVLIGWKRHEDKEIVLNPEDKDKACEWGSADELLVFEAAEYIALDARRDHANEGEGADRPGPRRASTVHRILPGAFMGGTTGSLKDLKVFPGIHHSASPVAVPEAQEANFAQRQRSV
jgi:hypothetical protein